MSKKELDHFINETLPKRTTFPRGGQIVASSLIFDIADQFMYMEHEDQVLELAKWFYKNVEILPYSKDDLKTVETEASIRWKRTATEVIETGIVYEGKYCNDAAIVFLACAKTLGYQTKLLKCFRKNDKNEIKIHSLPIVTPKDSETAYVVNVGSTKSPQNHWLVKIKPDTNLSKIEIKGWHVWKVAEDQWAMGLTDASQSEKAIIADAKRFYGIT